MLTLTIFHIVDNVTAIIIIVGDQKCIIYFILLNIPGQYLSSEKLFPVKPGAWGRKIYKIRSKMSGI